MPTPQPTLNGVSPSWSDQDGATFNIYGGSTVKNPDFKSIDWESTIERGIQRGAGGDKRKRTSGQRDNSASMVMYASGWKVLKPLLAAASPTGRLGDAVFDVTLPWSPPGSTEIFTLKLEGCALDGVKSSSAEGPDPNVFELTLNTMRIEDDGFEL